MASRPDFGPYPVIVNAAMTGNIISKVSFKHQIPAVNYSFDWTGSPVGVFSVQISNDYSENPDGTVKNAGHWTTLPLTSTITATGTPDNASVDIVTEGNSVRLVYTFTSGTGTLNALITGAVL